MLDAADGRRGRAARGPGAGGPWHRRHPREDRRRRRCSCIEQALERGGRPGSGRAGGALHRARPGCARSRATPAGCGRDRGVRWAARVVADADPNGRDRALLDHAQLRHTPTPGSTAGRSTLLAERDAARRRGSRSARAAAALLRAGAPEHEYRARRPGRSSTLREELETTAIAGQRPRCSHAYLQCAHVRLDAGDTELAGRYLAEARGARRIRWARSTPASCWSRRRGTRCSRAITNRRSRARALRSSCWAIRRARQSGRCAPRDRACPRRPGRRRRRRPEYRLAIDLLQRQTGWPTELAKAYRRYGKFLRRRGQRRRPWGCWSWPATPPSEGRLSLSGLRESAPANS